VRSVTWLKCVLIIDAICVGWWVGVCIYDSKRQWPMLVFSIAVTVLVFSRCIAGISAYNNQLYARTAVVTGLNQETDIVSVTDGAGIGWGFYGIEDWDVGDVVSMLMDNNGTPENIFDDEIIKATYAGILN